MKNYWMVSMFAVFFAVSGFAESLTLSFTGGVFMNEDGIALAEEGVPGSHATELGFAFDADVAGFYGTIEFANDLVNAPFRDYAAWISLFDVITIYGGKILYEDYVLADCFDDNDFNTPIADSEYGMALTLIAIEDFSVSMFIPAPDLVGTNAEGDEESVQTAWENVRPAFGLSGPFGSMGRFYLSYRSINSEIAVLAEVLAVEDTVILAGYTGVFDGEDHDTLHRGDLSVSRFVFGVVDAGLALRGEIRDDDLFVYGKIGLAYPREVVTPSVYVSVQGANNNGYEETGFGGTIECAPIEGASVSAGLEFVYGDSMEWGIPVLLSVEL